MMDIKRRKQIRKTKRILLLIVVLIAVSLAFFIIRGHSRYSKERLESMEAFLEPDYQVELLDVNDYSRPGIALNEVNCIVIHYTANPGSSAMDNRDYFNNLASSHLTKASAHFIVGLDGEVIQCIPTKEISYASNERNSDSISIESCIADESGAYNKKTYDSLVQTTAWLCAKFGLSSDNVIRHYDITGKICPKYFVDNEDAWIKFKQDVQSRLDKAEKMVNN